MKLVCVGQSAYDMTYFIHEPLIENQKYRIQERMECIGAPATNAACLCAQWGIDTTLVSRVGQDSYGTQILMTLQEQGVDTSYIKVSEGAKTSISTIITHTETGSRTIFNCPINDTQDSFAYPTQCDVLLMDGHEEAASMELRKRFPQAVTILDAGTAQPEVIRLAAFCDHLVCSQSFAQQYTGITLSLNVEQTVVETFQKLKELCSHQVVVTLGELGLLYEKEQRIYHMPARNVTAVDTTGAGDIFHGAYTYGVMMGWTLEKCLDIASRAAALSVGKMGGNPSIPSLQKLAMQVELERLKEN